MKLNETVVAVAMDEVNGACPECALMSAGWLRAYQNTRPGSITVDDSDSAWEYEMEHADEPLVNYGFGSDVSMEFIGSAGKYAFMLGTHADGVQFVAWVNYNDGDAVDQVDGPEFLQELMGWESFRSTYHMEYNRFLYEQAVAI